MAHVDSQTRPRRGPSLTQQIFIGLALGIVAGWLVSEYNPAAAIYFRPFSQLFLRLIKMIIAPLIFTTLVAGIAGAGHVKVVGRMGLRAIIYFEIVTTLALVIGLVAVNVMKPGVGVNLPMGQKSEIAAVAQTWDQILLHVVPESVIKAMAEGDVLQIVVFSILFAIALGMIGEKGRPVVAWCEAVAETMFKFTNIVMHYAPIGVGAAIAYTVGHGGLRVLVNLAWLVATLYLALAVFVLLVLLPVALHLQGSDPQVHQGGEGAGDHRVLDDVERSGAAARDGSHRAPRRAAQDRRLRPAARLQLQPRRHDALSVAGRRSSSRRRPACSCRSASRSRCC